MSDELVRGVFYSVIIVTVVLTATAMALWFERKFAARLQTRLGPTMVGPSPAWRFDHPQPALARRIRRRVRAAAVTDDDLEFAAQTAQRRRQIAHRRRLVERRDDNRDERVF